MYRGGGLRAGASKGSLKRVLISALGVRSVVRSRLRNIPNDGNSSLSSSADHSTPKLAIRAVENWQTHTERYDDRIARLSEPMQTLGPEIRALPFAPLDYKPSERGLLYYQLCLFVLAGCRSSSELVYSLGLLWRSGRFLSASLCIRLLIEIWGSSVYANRQVLSKLSLTGDIAAAKAKVARLLFGSRLSVPLPYGGSIKVKPVNVMDFIREADAACPGIMDTYQFLCDACHPSFFQHTWLLLAGAEQDNWSNERFAEYGHQLLDRSVNAAEQAISGIEESGVQIVRASLPMVLADRDKNLAL